jgi:TolB-like protein
VYATILVMPFAAAAPEDAADAGSLTSDIIFGVAKLRSISVIARGTAFAGGVRANSRLSRLC